MSGPGEALTISVTAATSSQETDRGQLDKSIENPFDPAML